MTSRNGRSWTLFACAAVVFGGTSCDSPSQPTQSPPQTEWIDPNQIEAGLTLHEKLPDDLLTRIKSVHATFAEVDGTPLEKWIDDFQRDLDPEANVRIWEDMQVAYYKYCQGRDLPLDVRKEVFKVVLFRSMASESNVLERIQLEKLSQTDAQEIMKGYPSAPKPIDVIQSPVGDAEAK